MNSADRLPSGGVVLRRRILSAVIEYAGLLGVLIILIILFASLTDNFFRIQTALTIANSSPDLIFVSVGMTLVLIVAGIDLSVGSLLALGAAVIGVAMTEYDLGVIPAIALCVLTTTCCGFLSGFVSAWFAIPSFIVTLGMLEMARGGTKLVTDNQSIYIGSKFEWFGEPIEGLSLSPSFLFAIATVLIAQFLLTQTVYGRYCIAIGTNKEAVKMSGIRTAPIFVATFAISGLLCGLASISHTGRLLTSDPNAARGLELSAIAACVIGGTSLMGGRGSVIASFIGVLIIAVLQSGLAQMGVDDAIKQLITGGVIILAVLLDSLRQRLSKETH
ncbi:ABC transporter permease [Roseiconus lacunae]|uniref:ABC transporter permease n=1 Tax=Roseiconus lacunae TaxID=2605694 RepID=A0ABT7PQ76_9BACT|nr:ABC transporter permease [Roseiconus lacunae]MCD0463030.1 ABC transporter permease [Roseiconus lacunae]MDM4018439.1 ABC transporter permease [Roseiconus lacunae]WRQ49137.1 ABC transporter permease [Stieleria sp. HD01]